MISEFRWVRIKRKSGSILLDNQQMEAEENGCRLSPSAYVSEEYDLEIGVTDLDLEVLMCENSKLQAELEEIQDEFVETMGEFIRLKQEWEGC